MKKYVIRLFDEKIHELRLNLNYCIQRRKTCVEKYLPSLEKHISILEKKISAAEKYKSEFLLKK